MVGRKKKTKICDKGPQEDWINKLPDDLISEILCYLPTKDAVRTSLLSTRWRTLWQLVPGLDLDSRAFSNVDAFVSFADRFFDSHKKSSWIRKLCLSIHDHNGNCVLTPWVDAVTTRSIQHLDLHIDPYYLPEIPSSIYTCQTLVHLRLYQAPLVNAEFVSLPCLKIILLEYVSCRNGAAFEKLISGSPVLEDLTLIRCSTDNAKVLQVRSHSLKRIRIDERTEVEIDAPLLQCLRTKISSKNFKIINLGNSTKLDIDVFSKRTTYSGSFICDILTDIERVRDLVISSVIWEDIFLYSESGPLLQFRYLSRLNAKFFKSDLEMLPTILESCPKLESFILNLVKDPFMRHRKNIEPKVMFSTVPPCLVSSLKFVELKRSTPRYEGEMELVRYFLKNSTILEKLRLDTSYYTYKAKCALLKELLAMPRCSTACEVLVL